MKRTMFATMLSLTFALIVVSSVAAGGGNDKDNNGLQLGVVAKDAGVKVKDLKDALDAAGIEGGLGTQKEEVGEVLSEFVASGEPAADGLNNGLHIGQIANEAGINTSELVQTVNHELGTGLGVDKGATQAAIDAYLAALEENSPEPMAYTSPTLSLDIDALLTAAASQENTSHGNAYGHPTVPEDPMEFSEFMAMIRTDRNYPNSDFGVGTVYVDNWVHWSGSNGWREFRVDVSASCNEARWRSFYGMYLRGQLTFDELVEAEAG